MGSLLVTSHLLRSKDVKDGKEGKEIVSKNINIGWNYKIEGNVMKKSKHFKNW